jgi:hypothetical protein
LIGEILQHQRSALDYLVWQLVKHAQGNPGNRTAFPIFRLEKEYEKQSSNMICGASPAAKDRIRKLQPFHRGAAFEKHPLWALHQLNNIDKHRLLLTTQMVMGHGLRQVSVRVDAADVEAGGGSIQPNLRNGLIENGIEFVAIKTQNPKKKADFKLACSVGIKDAGLPPIEAVYILRFLSRYVGRVLNLFEQDFGNPEARPVV